MVGRLAYVCVCVCGHGSCDVCVPCWADKEAVLRTQQIVASGDRPVQSATTIPMGSGRMPLFDDNIQ